MFSPLHCFLISDDVTTNYALHYRNQQSLGKPVKVTSSPLSSNFIHDTLYGVQYKKVKKNTVLYVWLNGVEGFDPKRAIWLSVHVNSVYKHDTKIK